MAIRQGVTPTFTLTVPETVDLTAAANVYATFDQGKISLTKTGTDLTVSAQTVDVFLSQQETIMFQKGYVAIQLNWTYSDGSRGCSEIKSIPWDINLLPEVLQ